MLLYASMYHDVTVIVNISGRFALEQGIEGRLGKNYMERIRKDGYIDVRNRKGVSLMHLIWHLFCLSAIANNKAATCHLILLK